MPYKDASLKFFTHVVDDDVDINGMLAELAKELGIHNAFFYECPTKFLEELTDDLSICVIDHSLPGMTGLEVLKKVKEKNKDSFVIVMSGQENMHVAIEYTNAGVDKYIYKDIKGKYLLKLEEYWKYGLIEAQERMEKEKIMKEHHVELEERMKETRHMISQLK